MNQNNTLIGLGALVILLLLFSFSNHHWGWGMMGSFDGDMFEEMNEHMNDDDQVNSDETMFDEMNEHMGGAEEDSDTRTSAENAPEGSMHNLPVPEAVSAVRTAVSQELGIEEGVVIILSAYEQEWSNGCLGLATDSEMCTQALVPGYQVTVLAQGNERVFHTNADGSVMREKK